MKFRKFLSAKLHGGRITQCDLHYEGSCGLGPDLRAAAGLLPLERVAVLNVNTGSRLETYVIAAERNGEISLNGAAARHGSVGDTVIILSYTAVSEDEIPAHQARIVILGDQNQVLSTRNESPQTA